MENGLQEDYFYKFNYTNGNYKHTVEFDASCTLDYLLDNFKRFMIGAGWTRTQVDSILTVDEVINGIEQ